MTHTTFTIDDITRIGQSLHQTKRPTAALSRREAVQQLQPVIREKRQQGWRFTDIAAFLCEQGLPLSASLLSQYYRESQTVTKRSASTNRRPARTTAKRLPDLTPTGSPTDLPSTPHPPPAASPNTHWPIFKADQ